MEENKTTTSVYKLKKSQRVYLVFKRIIDIFGSIVGILLLFPLMVLISIIIKCSSKGPILFKQKRLGKDKKVFILLKFRSMHANAPEIPPSEMTEEQQRAMQYKFGHFLRRSSLDEIPQLFNIFIGQMSFIGPRPGAAKGEEELMLLRDSYTPSAYMVKPGLAGLAQNKLKRDNDPHKKAELDSEYVKKLSFCIDFKTFFGTFKPSNKGR